VATALSPFGGIEPIFGVLKEQRGMRQFRRRGLETVAVEMALAATAYNLTRMWNTAAAGAKGS
jgi:IS5 family transposase